MAREISAKSPYNLSITKVKYAFIVRDPYNGEATIMPFVTYGNILPALSTYLAEQQEHLLLTYAEVRKFKVDCSQTMRMIRDRQEFVKLGHNKARRESCEGDHRTRWEKRKDMLKQTKTKHHNPKQVNKAKEQHD